MGLLENSRVKKTFKTNEDAANYLKQALNDVGKMNGFFLVAERGNKIIGFIYGVVVKNENDIFHNLTHIFGKEGWIGIVFVDEKNRKIELGKKLVLEAKNRFKDSNCSSIRLIVDSDNQEAIGFYSKLGFIEYEKKMFVQIQPD